ncbi:transposase [Xanthomonas oryzae pv. oryzicola]|nr:transposase [Xanthomonas oryzae pv. oryzicola]
MSSPISYPEQPGREAAFCRSEASYYLWRSKFGGMSVPDAKRLKDLEAENTRLKKLLAEQVFQNALIKDALQKKW